MINYNTLYKRFLYLNFLSTLPSLLKTLAKLVIYADNYILCIQAFAYIHNL